MKLSLSTVLRTLGLLSFLAAVPLHADENPPEVLEKAGAMLGAMKEEGQAYQDSRFKRGGLTPEARAALARKTALRLAGYRDDLAALAPRLHPDTRFAADLGRFVERWPDDSAFRRDLLDDRWGERVQLEITSLWLQVPDRRPAWKTPLPLFRP